MIYEEKVRNVHDEIPIMGNIRIGIVLFIFVVFQAVKISTNSFLKENQESNKGMLNGKRKRP
jgi:hypothetical protein